MNTVAEFVCDAIFQFPLAEVRLCSWNCFISSACRICTGNVAQFLYINSSTRLIPIDMKTPSRFNFEYFVCLGKVKNRFFFSDSTPTGNSYSSSQRATSEERWERSKKSNFLENVAFMYTSGRVSALVKLEPKWLRGNPIQLVSKSTTIDGVCVFISRARTASPTC